MAGLGNDFVSDRMADAAIDGFMELGVAKGITMALGTTAAAAAGTVVAMAAPLVIVAGIVWLCGGFDDPKPKVAGDCS